MLEPKAQNRKEQFPFRHWTHCVHVCPFDIIKAGCRERQPTFTFDALSIPLYPFVSFKIWPWFKELKFYPTILLLHCPKIPCFHFPKIKELIPFNKIIMCIGCAFWCEIRLDHANRSTKTKWRFTKWPIWNWIQVSYIVCCDCWNTCDTNCVS